MIPTSASLSGGRRERNRDRERENTPPDVTSDTHWIPRTFPCAALHHPRRTATGTDRRGSHRRRRSDGDMITLRVSPRYGARTSVYRSLALQQVSRHQLSCFALRSGDNDDDGDDGDDGYEKEREREGFSAHGGNEAGMKTHPQERGVRARARASRYLGHAARGRDARFIRLRPRGTIHGDLGRYS